MVLSAAGAVFAAALVLQGIVLGLSSLAYADAGKPAAHDNEAFDVMNFLTDRGLHDIEAEPWNAYGQFTYISSWKRPFAAAYTNLGGSTNSMSPQAERSFTGSATMYVGLRLWAGAEAYFVPEIIAERPLSQLTGLGGAIQNGELQKNGTSTPQIYRSQTFIKQTISLGGSRQTKTSDPLQLGQTVDSHRIVLIAGNFTILDFFDKNSFAGDVRQQFLNMAFLTHAAYDFASDARGYSWGGVAELHWDDWAVRVARMTPPQNPNVLPVDFRLAKYYGDQMEIEHRHTLAGQPGAVKLLGYRNREWMGRFDQALAAFAADPAKNATTCQNYNYNSGNATAPDLCWSRRENTKMGIGLNVEQALSEDIGIFARGMISDGQTEVYAYTSTDRSASIGLTARGTPWRRPFDIAGLGMGVGWISSNHAAYLAAGGIDGFIGDGNLHVGAENVEELFYSFNFLRTIWLTADLQRIGNPAFNSDRGPVTILGARIHAEF